ncbi:signal recognition particle protein (SRP9) domain-containing protein [Purpureocillium lavendulum]|uniref:Signal recognition particle protein (SRP9) domain-containing protein n=1 Tax=Purpureocillium lavendulum TaxID=1247861 RepID=A0AB34G629_9HYPO|nr:signal recognition particle protein (SRP9) domain-containing protein [Purpureocillium lavendulum]
MSRHATAEEVLKAGTMPYFKTSQEWLEQSTLLLEARPSTTRITTKYSIKPVKPRAKKPQEQQTEEPSAGAAAAAATAAAGTKPPRGSLVLKSYDPVSGSTLKYRTTKAAEVSRLMGAALGRLGKGMAAVPVDTPEEAMPDAAAGTGADDGVKAGSGAAAQAQQPQQAQQGAGGGGKKKKKGRR